MRSTSHGSRNPEKHKKSAPYVVPRALMLAGRNWMRLCRHCQPAPTARDITHQPGGLRAGRGRAESDLVIGGRLNSRQCRQAVPHFHIVVEADESDASFLNLCR
jgi:hypothetical protein